MEQHGDAESTVGSEEALVLPARTTRSSNGRAFKVAGLTVLACLLLASQVFTAYMLITQKEQIHSLQSKSDSLRQQMANKPKVALVKMNPPMNTIPLMDFSDDQDKKAEMPKTNLPDVPAPVDSVEKQVKDFLQNFQVPQSNGTFLTNVQALQKQMDATEWAGFESWLRQWLIFQIVQEKQAPQLRTACQLASAPGAVRVGSYQPQCDERGQYNPIQCWYGTGICWCVNDRGTPIPGTRVKGRPDCHRALRPLKTMSFKGSDE